MKLVFGLNVLKRVKTNPGQAGKPVWDSTNARELIQYSINKGYKIFGFELGNEENEVPMHLVLANGRQSLCFRELLLREPRSELTTTLATHAGVHGKRDGHAELCSP